MLLVCLLIVLLVYFDVIYPALCKLYVVPELGSIGIVSFGEWESEFLKGGLKQWVVSSVVAYC